MTSRGRAALRARTQVLEVAKQHFREYGYDRTSLAEIGAEVGLTRGGVLYHFPSKPTLLEAVVEPFTTGLTAALDELEQQQPPPGPAVVVDRVLDLLIENRPASELLAHDIATRHALDLDAWFTASAARLAALLTRPSGQDRSGPSDTVRGYAAFGAMIRPLVHLPGPVSDAVRATLRHAALHALQPATPSGSPG